MFKIGLKKVGILLVVCSLTWAYSQKTGASADPAAKSNGVKKHKGVPKSSDSLKVLSVILQSEFAGKNKVFICKNTSFADSLARSLCGPENFKSAISDSAVLMEIKSQEDFSRYWKNVEIQNGIPDLKNQMNAHDVDKTRIPKAYAFDSSVVIYPGWIIIRKK